MADKRVALVTGANRGIGLEIARQLVRKGLNVVLGARTEAKGRAAAKALKADGLEATPVRLDVNDKASVDAGVADTLRRFKRIDVLVNNAAILIDGPGGFEASVCDLSEDTLRKTLETNLFGPLRMIQAVLPAMQEKDYGRIVNLSSGAGQLTDMSSGYPAYRMSKTALNALMRTTAAELGDGNLKINSMCPGWVRTEMGGPGATRSVEEGADTAVWLATLPASGPNGGFFRDRKPIPW